MVNHSGLVAKLACLSLVAFVPGCASVPSAAPTVSELLDRPENAVSRLSYEVFDIDAEVARIAGAKVNDTFGSYFGGRGSQSSPVIGSGDILSVSIFESALGGLFTAPETSIGASSKNVTLPQVLVDSTGNIRIPFAGNIRAKGRSPREIEQAIEARLKGRAIDPQVIVTLTTNKSAMVTVSGEVRSPSRFPVGIAHERLLDVISQAGGSNAPPHESVVKVIRGERLATVNLKTVFNNPRENIFIRPGDTILIEKMPRTIIVLGAASRNFELRFETDHVTLANALGQAGGLVDSRSDPTGVFVFRFERPELVQRLRPSWTGTAGGNGVPTIYKLDLRTAPGYFLAQSFQMRNKDMIFIANADSAQLLKVFQLVGTVLGTSGGVASTAVRLGN